MGILNNTVLGIIGLVLSSYSVYVEYMVEQQQPGEEKAFKALCDIDSIGASCSTVFSLPEGKMLSYFHILPRGHTLDIPNGILGMMYYLFTISYCITGGWQRKKLDDDATFLFNTINLGISSLALGASIFLGTRLYIIRELCIVCVTTHIINVTLWVRAVLAFNVSKSKMPTGAEWAKQMKEKKHQ